MSWIAVMVGVGVGATAGGVTTGLNGGSTEDILKSMAIGGAMGGAGGGIGGALAGPAAGAAAGSTSGAASGATTGATTGALTGSTTGTLGAAGNAAATSAITPTLSSAATGAVGGGTTGAVGGGTGGAGFAGISGGSGLLAGGTGGATGGVSGGGIGSLGASGNQAAVSALNPQSVMSSSESLAGQSGFVGPTATPDQIANASAYTDANMGTRFLADLTGQQGNIVGNTGLKMAGGALQSGVMNAGINGLVAGAQGQDVGEAMGKGALTGAVGGAAGAGLASMAGSGGTLGSIGNFAAKHDVLVPAALSMGSGMALDNALTSDPTMPEERGIRANVKWNPSVYRPYGPQFAAGGITDLDNYDQTPQMQSPGTLDIPSRNEVANNQGYMGDSVQMMAHGGISDLGGYSDGGRLLKGPGTGVSDDIPATIEGRQPARLAANEFVVPARIVSEIGNGSTDAGAKALYAMMDRVQKDRKKSMGKGKFAVDSKAARHLDNL